MTLTGLFVALTGLFVALTGLFVALTGLFVAFSLDSSTAVPVFGAEGFGLFSGEPHLPGTPPRQQTLHLIGGLVFKAHRP